jgi:hypothetical protein
MRLRSVCTSAPRLPAAIVASAITESVEAALVGKRKAALSRKAKPAALVPVAMNVVTGVGAPWYTSGTHRWKGNTLILKKRLPATSARPTSASGVPMPCARISPSEIVPVPP